MEKTLIQIWFNKESAISGKDPWKIQIGDQTHFVSEVNFQCKITTKCWADSFGNLHSRLEAVSTDFIFKDNTLTIK